MHHKLWALLPLILFSLWAKADDDKTRGIGQYPGRQREAFIPQRMLPADYANQAWMRQAWASSSIDYNLTAQLATDGILTQEEPARVRVTTSDGELSLRDREKTFDGNTVTSVYVMGDDAFIQYDWTGMAVATRSLRLNAWAAYREQQADSGYEIVVEASPDGAAWQKIGALRGEDLPGKATRQTAASDPNKQEAIERLPLRLMDLSIPVAEGRYNHLRIRLKMKGCAYWRLYECVFTDDERGMLPSNRFASMWMAEGRGSGADTPSVPQWIAVDLGRPVAFDTLRLSWRYPAIQGRVQASDDAQTWRDVASLSSDENRRQEVVTCRETARYVRLLLERPGSSGLYALSELEVWGRPATPAPIATPEGVPTVSLQQGKRCPLTKGWELRRDGYDRWLPATVPGTVLTSFIHNGAVPDNTVGDAMRQISESYFNSDFWYRTSFRLSSKLKKGERVFLHLDGINWKADLLVNGQPVGRIEGAFRRGRFDLTPYLTRGDNTLEVCVHKNAHIGAVKVKNSESTDINGGVLGLDNPTFHATIGWDWITSTPGREVGIWDDVWLSLEGDVHVSDPYVTTRLEPSDTLASMTPVVRVTNNTSRPVTTTVSGWIGSIRFEQPVRLAPQESRDVAFSPDNFPQLRRQPMRLWWPNGYGEPYLYDAGFSAAGDEVRYKAGIREVAYEDMDTALKIFVNHQRIMVMGGNWGFSETNLNYRAREFDAAVRYHHDMNMTMIRNWVGQTGSEAFFVACDRYGLMVWQDFWLANPWDGPDPADNEMFMDNARDFISRIRRHPSLALYCGRNEGYPPEVLDQGLRQSVAALHPQLGYISSSADDGVSGHGPYTLMPVSYYFSHTSSKLHSEQGVPCVPNPESLRRMLPSGQLWPQGDAWGQHDFTMLGAQRGAAFNEKMERCLGRPTSMEQYSAWAQWLNYDGHRAMFEAATSQQGMGLLMWMSHPTWPSMVWQTYDYYFDPTAGYFGVKKACEPLHVLYNPVAQRVEVVNHCGKDAPALEVSYTLYDQTGRIVRSDSLSLAVASATRADAFPVVLPQRTDSLTTPPEVFFLRLLLRQGDEIVSRNDYVLSQEEGCFQALRSLPPARVAVTPSLHREGNEWRGTVKVTNLADTPALMLRLNLKDSDGDQVLPVVYGDNYFHLMPHEERVITISFADEDVRAGRPTVEVTSLL